MKRHELRDLVNESGLSLVQRSVLRHLGERAAGKGGELGEAWPSVADIAHCIGAKRTAVKGALKDLRASGWLVDTGRRVGRGSIVFTLAKGVGKRPAGRQTTGSANDPLRVGKRPSAGRQTTTEEVLEETNEEVPSPNLSQRERNQLKNSLEKLDLRQRRKALEALRRLRLAFPGEGFADVNIEGSMSNLRDGCVRNGIAMDGIRQRDLANGLRLERLGEA